MSNMDPTKEQTIEKLKPHKLTVLIITEEISKRKQVVVYINFC